MPRPTWDELRAIVKTGAEARLEARRLATDKRSMTSYLCGIAQGEGWTPVALNPTSRFATWKFASAEWQGTCLCNYRIGKEKIAFRFKHNEGFEAEWKQKKSRRMLANAVKKARQAYRQSR